MHARHRHTPSHIDPREVQRSMLSLRTSIGISFAQRAPRASEPPDIVFKRVRSLRADGFLEHAETLLKDCLASDPCSRLAAYELIDLYSHAGQIKKAGAIFDYAFSRDIAGDGIYSAMVSGYCRNKMKDEALTVFDMADARGLLMARTCRTMFFTAYESDDLKAMEDVFSKSASAGHADAAMFSRLVSQFVRERGPDRALKLFRSHELQFASVRAYNSIANGLASERRHREAAGLCDEALSRGMADAEMIDSIIRTMDSNKDPCSPWELYWNAVRAGAADERLHRTVIDIYAKYGKGRRIKVIFDALIKADADTLPLYQCALYALASGRDLGWAGDILNAGCRRGRMNADDIAYFFSRLYSERLFRELGALYGKLPPDIRGEPILVFKAADAMRKRFEHERAIQFLGTFLARGDITQEHMHKAYAIMAFCLKDSGRKSEAMELLLTLRHTAPEGNYSPRIACGLVFCWEELGFGNEISQKLADSLHRALQEYRSFARNNLLHDIEKAIALLEGRFRESGSPECTGT